MTEARDAELEEILRAFVRDRRLRSIPAKPSKRALLMRWLLEQCFPEDRIYSEREVNIALEKWHEDFAALRRYLIDEKLMSRDHGEYRRTYPPGHPEAVRSR